MAEETEDKKAEEPGLRRENKTLKARLEAMAADLTEAKNQRDSCMGRIDSQTATIKSLEDEVARLSAPEPSGPSISVPDGALHGHSYELEVIVTAKELMDRMLKRFVEQDAPVAVLKRV